MDAKRLEEARELIKSDESMHSAKIKNNYRATLKRFKKEGSLDDAMIAELDNSLHLLLEKRKRNKSEKIINRDKELHNLIRDNIDIKKWFAPKLWFKVALPIIIWAVLQEIIMASTDLVDNFFVNWLRPEHVHGIDDLNSFINLWWNNHDFNADWFKAAGIALDYQNLDYSAGQIAVNGVTASNQLYTIMYCVVSGSCYGIGVFSAQYYGAGNYERLKSITAMKLYFTLFVTSSFALIALPGVTEYLIKFTTNPGQFSFTDNGDWTVNNAADLKNLFNFIQYRAANLSTEQGVIYFRTIFWSYMILAINESIITSLRETRRPIYSFLMSVVSLATNCLLNLFLTAPMFLGGFHGLGIRGTALATALSRVVQLVVISCVIIHQRFEFIPHWRSFVIKRKFIQRVFLKTFPIIINEFLFALGQVMMVKLRGMYSVEVLTANAIFTTVFSALMSPLYHGVNAGISVFVGNELGADRFDIAEYNAKNLMKLSFMIGVIFAIVGVGLGFLVPNYLFSSANADAKFNAIWMIVTFSIIYPVYSITNSSYSILRTGGSMWGAFFMDSGLLWSFEIPLIALFILLNKYGVLTMPYIDIHLISLVYYFFQATISFTVYKKKYWVRNISKSSSDVIEIEIKDINEVKQNIKDQTEKPV